MKTKTLLKTFGTCSVLFLGLMGLSEAAFALTFTPPGNLAGGLQAAAAAGVGGGMPWEGPLVQIQRALTGGAAKAIAVIAMAVAGGMLAFGGELSEFAKRICMVVIAAATMIMASKIIEAAGLIPGT